MISIDEIANKEGFNVLEKTKSVDDKTIKDGKVPKVIDAAYAEKDGMIYLVKANGTKERIGTKEYWEKIMRFKAKENYVAKINTEIEHRRDLGNCGLCKQHKNTTALLNVVATNRCD